MLMYSECDSLTTRYKITLDFNSTSIYLSTIERTKRINLVLNFFLQNQLLYEEALPLDTV